MGAVTSHDRVAAAAAKSLQSCPTLCDPRDGSPPGSPVPGILQARTLEWVAISFMLYLKWITNKDLLYSTCVCMAEVFHCSLEIITTLLIDYSLTVLMYGCESWTVKKAEHTRIDAFELWC